MDELVLANQQEVINHRTVQIQDVVWKTCREQWMIGTNGERERERERESQGNPCSQCDLMMIYKHDLTLNILLGLICNKNPINQLTNQLTNQPYTKIYNLIVIYYDC